jgi:hypothetical protein
VNAVHYKKIKKAELAPYSVLRLMERDPGVPMLTVPKYYFRTLRELCGEYPNED